MCGSVMDKDVDMQVNVQTLSGGALSGVHHLLNMVPGHLCLPLPQPAPRSAPPTRFPGLKQSLRHFGPGGSPSCAVGTYL